MWNGEPLEATFYLRPGDGSGDKVWESLRERLNDLQARFLACRIGGHLELLNVDAVACVEVEGTLPEVDQEVTVGALRLPAMVSLRSGQSFAGEFLAILPPERSRLSDLLSSPRERFLLFVDPFKARYIQREAIDRVRPGDPLDDLMAE
jgi:hypothetical protein